MLVAPARAGRLHGRAALEALSQAEAGEKTSSDSDSLPSSAEGMMEYIARNEYEPFYFEPLGETVDGAAIGVMIRDSIWMVIGTGTWGLRLANMLMSWLLMFFSIFIQWTLLLAIGSLLVARQSKSQQSLYDRFEAELYGNHTTGPEGQRRGVKGSFDVGRFVNMQLKDRERICQTALAHPSYLFIILWLWTMSCMAEVRRVWDTSNDLVFNLKTIRSFRREEGPGATAPGERPSPVRKGMSGVWHRDAERPIIVDGLTLPLKAGILFLCMLPRLVTAIVLLWLGCGVLTATDELKDLLLNSTALEFVLLVKELLYHVIVPRTNRSNLQRLKFKTLEATAPVECFTYFSTVTWGVLSVIWVKLYMSQLQGIVPGYKWDVRPVCRYHGLEVKVFMFL